ncbi:MAG TPA: patatin-like phospholipase family protein [Burkholderiaceae bacterium]|nr:patatin-like phospholipase family protein [Burkholderiaceae bacterium]
MSSQAVAGKPAPGERRYPLALALGGGCIRAFAHVGVIKALEAGGIRPDLIVGTSAGGMVGALYAAGLNGTRLETAANSLTWDVLQELRPSKFGVYSLEPLRRLVNRETGGKTIERFPTRFAVVATDLRTGEATALDQGEPGLAVMASSSVPGLVRPTTIGGREYIDGGVASPVPIRVARALGADIVVGIDVSYRPEEAVLNNAVDVALQAFSIATRHLGATNSRRPT